MCDIKKQFVSVIGQVTPLILRVCEDPLVMSI